MKKILVVSDSHGSNKLLASIRQIHSNVDYAFCLGDTYLDIDDPQLNGYISVQGNNDFNDMPFVEICSFEDARIYLTHGHLQYVGYDQHALPIEAIKNDCNIALYGHTHSLAFDTIDGIPCICPGSISQPRGRRFPTYLVLCVGNGLIHIKTYHAETHAELVEYETTLKYNN
jgi:uncharacterized protein